MPLFSSMQPCRFFTGMPRIWLRLHVAVLLIGALAWAVPGMAGDVTTFPVTAGTGETVTIQTDLSGSLTTGTAIGATAGGRISGTGINITVTNGPAPVVDSNGAGSEIRLTGANTAITAGADNTAPRVVSAEDGGLVELQGTVTATTADSVEQIALSASGDGSSITMTGGTINARYIGVEMRDGGWVDPSGSTINLDGRETGSLGVHVVAPSPPSGSAPISNLTINIAGDAHTDNYAWIGVLAQGDGASVVFDQLTVGGDDANLGGAAADGAVLTVTNSNIAVNGLIGGGNLRVWPVSHDFEGVISMGLLAYSGGTVTATDTNVTVATPASATNQGAAYGIYAIEGSTLSVTGGSVTMTGDGSATDDNYRVGIIAFDNSEGTVSGTTVITNGRESMGIMAAQESSLTADGVSVTATGDESFVVRAEEQSEITLTNGTLLATGEESYGLVAALNSTITGTNSTITTQGAGSIAINVDTESTVDLTGGSVQATGTDNLGARLEGNDSTLRMTNVDFYSTGEGVSIEGPGANVGMSGGSLVSEYTAFQVRDTGSVVTIDSGARVEARNGRLLDVAAAGGVTLSAAGGSTLLGDMRSANPADTIVNLNTQATWTGAAENLGELTMAGGSLWNMTADSDVASFTLANSTTAFSPPEADAFKTLTVHGDYHGENGTISLNTQLGADDSPTDRLLVEGSTSGQTGLTIVNAGGSGALTTGEGIEVVTVEQNSDGEFTLANRVVAGGVYEYSLYRGSTSDTANNWYLRNTLILPFADDPIPDIRPEVPLAGAISGLASEYGFAMVDNLHRRVGELFPPAGEMLGVGGERRPAAWARLIGSRVRHKGGDFLSDGPSWKYTLKGAQVGMDLLGDRQAGGGNGSAGMYFGYGRMSSDVNGFMGGKAGNVKLDGYSLGAYWTHRGVEPWYTDVVVQGTLYRANARSVYGERIKPHGKGVLASLESGYAFQLTPGVVLEPQAQIAWQFVSMGDAHDSFGEFSYNRGNSLRGRLGLRLAKQWESGAEDGRKFGSVWVRGNVWREFLGKHTYRVAARGGGDSMTFKAPLDGTWGEIEAGIAGQVTERITLFATAAYSHSLDNKGRRGWDCRLGAVLRF